MSEVLLDSCAQQLDLRGLEQLTQHHGAVGLEGFYLGGRYGHDHRAIVPRPDRPAQWPSAMYAKLTAILIRQSRYRREYQPPAAGAT